MLYHRSFLLRHSIDWQQADYHYRAFYTQISQVLILSVVVNFACQAPSKIMCHSFILEKNVIN